MGTKDEMIIEKAIKNISKCVKDFKKAIVMQRGRCTKIIPSNPPTFLRRVILSHDTRLNVCPEHVRGRRRMGHKQTWVMLNGESVT